MGYLKKTVSVNGTEAEFIKELVSTITSVDERITCDDDIDSIFSDTSTTPTISFNIGNYCVLTLTRGAVLTSNTNSYRLNFVDKTNTYKSAEKTVQFSNGSNPATNTTIRELNILVVTSDNAVVIAIENYNISTPSSFTNKFIILIDDELSAIPSSSFSLNSSSSQYINQFTFYRIDTDGLGESFKFRNNLAFEMGGETLKKIDKKIMVNAIATENYYGEYLGLYDTSYTTANQILTINGEKYFAVDKCTMIKIKE